MIKQIPPYLKCPLSLCPRLSQIAVLQALLASEFIYNFLKFLIGDADIFQLNAQPDTRTGIRNRALLSLWYDFLARRSKLAGMTVQDITFSGDGSLRGVIRRSKTDQYGSRRLCFGSQRSATLLRQWRRAKTKNVDWVFCALNHGRCIDRPICDRTVNKIIKQSSVRLRGERPRKAEISGHSLRVGAAQDLLIKGFSTSAIMRAGG